MFIIHARIVLTENLYMCGYIDKTPCPWYVSNVSTFPNAFPLILDCNLHDLNQTNPGLTLFSVELLLGILLLGVNRPIWAGLTSSVVKYVKAREGRWGLKARGRFKACSRKPALVVNLYCKLEISRDQTGHIYEPVLGLCEPTGVTRVYKGTTRRRFRTTDNNSRLRRSLFAP